jgi:hypothetical protein
MIDATFKITEDSTMRVRPVKADHEYAHRTNQGGILVSVEYDFSRAYNTMGTPGEWMTAKCRHCGADGKSTSAGTMHAQIADACALVKHDSLCSVLTSRPIMWHFSKTEARAIASAIMGAAAEA